MVVRKSNLIMVFLLCYLGCSGYQGEYNAVMHVAEPQPLDEIVIILEGTKNWATTNLQYHITRTTTAEVTFLIVKHGTEIVKSNNRQGILVFSHSGVQEAEGVESINLTATLYAVEARVVYDIGPSGRGTLTGIGKVIWNASERQPIRKLELPQVPFEFCIHTIDRLRKAGLLNKVQI